MDRRARVPDARVRVVDLETGGGGVDAVCEVGWQDVVRDAHGAGGAREKAGGARFPAVDRWTGPVSTAFLALCLTVYVVRVVRHPNLDRRRT